MASDACVPFYSHLPTRASDFRTFGGSVIMTAKTSLFTKILAAALASGQSNRTATRNALLIQAASFADFKRLTPEQNVRQGRSRKARRYALKDVKRVTKATPTISARQYEAKKTQEQFGLTPEQATEARRRGAIPYVSAGQRERVAKAATTREENRVVAEIKRMQAAGRHVPSNSPDKRRHGRFHPVTPDTERRYREIRRRKLAGELIPDGEWHWFIDYARQFKDPRYELLRGSPGAFGFSLIA
jgi:hypothetical protein